MPPSPEYNNMHASYLKDKAKVIAVYKKPIDIRKKRYMGFVYPPALPKEMLPNMTIIAPFTGVETVEDFLELHDDVVMEYYAMCERQKEKYSLKREKKRPWSYKITRNPINEDVRDKVERLGLKELFHKILALVKEFAVERPIEKGKRGPDAYYDRKMIVALFIMKEINPNARTGFKSIRLQLKGIGLDFRVSDKAKDVVPSETRLKELYRDERLRRWMREFLNWLGIKKVGDILSLLGCQKREFVVDSTKVSSYYSEVREHGIGKRYLRKETFEVQFLYDITADVIVDVRVDSSHHVGEFLVKVPGDSTVYADEEFFTARNCILAYRLGIDFQVMPRKDSKPRGVVKDVVSEFDRRRYRRRKNGERGAKPFDELNGTRFRRHDSRVMLVTIVAVAMTIKRLMMLEKMVSMFAFIRIDEARKWRH